MNSYFIVLRDMKVVVCILEVVCFQKNPDRCATASVATASLRGCELRQPLPQETVAVGQPLLLGNHV